MIRNRPECAVELLLRYISVNMHEIFLRGGLLSKDTLVLEHWLVYMFALMTDN